jgi:hypothetical protein
MGTPFGNREPPKRAGISAEIPFSGAAPLQDRRNLRPANGGNDELQPNTQIFPARRGKNVLTVRAKRERIGDLSPQRPFDGAILASRLAAKNDSSLASANMAVSMAISGIALG